MNNTEKTIQNIVNSAIMALNEELPEGERIDTTSETRLIGPNGALTSLQVVNLVIQVEEGIAEHVGAELDLTTNEDLFNEDGPLQTVGTLKEYLSKTIPVGDE